MNYRSLKLWLLLLAVSPCQAFGSTYFRIANLVTNDIVYDKFSDTIYASVPSSVGATRGNTITPINPHTGALGTSVFVASEPSILALADDGSRIYVASNNTNLVTPFSLSTMSPGTSFPIGSGDRRVQDMEVAPGDATVLAVSKRIGNTPMGIAMFVNGVQLPKTTTDSAWNNVIEFGANANTLHGHASSLSDRDFNKFLFDLTPTGGFIDSVYNAKHLLTSGGLDMEYEIGRMYFTNGQVLEVMTPGPVGQYGASGPVQPDAATGRTYFLSGNSLKTFSQATYVSLGSFPVPGMTGSAKNLISLGADGLAFATTTGQVIIARGSLVEGPTGDFDADDDVDGDDLLAWQRGVGISSGALRAQGDGNGDGAVDGADLATWKQQFGASPGTTAGTIQTPEPAVPALLMGLAAALSWRRRRTRQITRDGCLRGQ